MNALTLTRPWWLDLLQFVQPLLTALQPKRQPLAWHKEADDEEEVIVEDDDDTGPSIEEIRKRQEKLTERLFGDDDDETPPKKGDDDDDDEPKPPKKKEEKPDDTKPPKKEEKPDADDDDLDYEEDDDEDPSKKDDEDGDDADDPNLTDEQRETLARKQAKENGRLAKELKTELTEAKLRETTLREELTEAQERLAELNKVTVDPKSTPEYVELNNAMWEDVDTAVAEELPKSAAALADRFPAYLKDYLKAIGLSGVERTAAIEAIKGRIITDLGDFQEPYEDLIDDDRAAADTLAKSVLSVIRRNKDRAKEMIKLETELREKSKSGRLAIGVTEYERSKKVIDSMLSPIGQMDEKLIEENPFAPDSVVAQMVKEHPKLAKRLETAKADVTEVIMGQRPLTQKEYDQLEEQGVDIKEFLKERKRKFEAKRAKLLPLLVRGLFATTFTNKTLESIAKEARDKQDTDDELEALAAIERKRRPGKAKESDAGKPKVPASQRPLAIERFLSDD